MTQPTEKHYALYIGGYVAQGEMFYIQQKINTALLNHRNYGTEPDINIKIVEIEPYSKIK